MNIVTAEQIEGSSLVGAIDPQHLTGALELRTLPDGRLVLLNHTGFVRTPRGMVMLPAALDAAGVLQPFNVVGKGLLR